MNSVLYKKSSKENIQDLKEEIFLLKKELEEHRQYKRLYLESLEYIKIANDKLSKLVPSHE